MKSILIGSVRSSETVLKQMINCDFPVDMVFSLDEKFSANVSGYHPIHEVAAANGIPYKKFKKISDIENIEIIREIAPDYIFVIGISQLIPKEIISLAKVGCVGFHPTPLPKFRGRAAIVWQMLLGIHNTKCTMFFLDEGMDSGDILDQEPYYISDEDYVDDVSLKLNEAIKVMSNRIFKNIKAGTLNPIKQNEEEATYLLMRTPEDGRIDWQDSVKKIHCLIRATSKPYPGAFSLYDNKSKIIIWKAEIMENKKYIGLPGQICEINDGCIDVLGVDGIIRITEYSTDNQIVFRLGHKLY